MISFVKFTRFSYLRLLVSIIANNSIFIMGSFIYYLFNITKVRSTCLFSFYCHRDELPLYIARFLFVAYLNFCNHDDVKISHEGWCFVIASLKGNLRFFLKKINAKNFLLRLTYFLHKFGYCRILQTS